MSEYTFPEVMPFRDLGYATYIPSRKPNFKSHASLGLAKSALTTRRWTDKLFHTDMALYKIAPKENGDLVWKLHTAIRPGTGHADYPDLWGADK